MKNDKSKDDSAMGPNNKSWSESAFLIANMGDKTGILRMLAVLLSGTQMILFFSGTQTMNKLTTQISDYNIEDGQGKITNEFYILILGVTLQKEGIEKEWKKFGQNSQNLRQQTKGSLTRLGQ